MKYSAFLSVFVFVMVMLSVALTVNASSGGNGVVRHNLNIALHPAEKRFTAMDSVTVPKNLLPGFTLRLHRGLAPSSATPGVSIDRVNDVASPDLLESYTVTLPEGLDTFILKYGGSIYHPVEKGNEQARGFSDSPGIISDEGVYLAGSSYWYPHFDADLMTFELSIELPAGWEAVCQGDRTLHERSKDTTRLKWESPEPQDEIFVIAARFTEYGKKSGRIAAMVFLRSPDNELAGKYLDATARYIAMYEKLIGAYPYRKFALVENFWETGFGMPSFTLIGPTVIRLPFIINSSYPHEILHNWWGNGVFVNYSEGNWSEGLTAYLSDHLLKEQQGGGAEYRMTTLQKYADYVLGGRDFMLTEFRSRHSSASEAVGYGKSLMFFHMLRMRLGDGTFISGIRDFYEKNRFRFASFGDLRESFERVSGKDLRAEFDQWVARRGAPELRLGKMEAEQKGSGYLLRATLQQVQKGDAYSLRVPLSVTLEGQEKSFQITVDMDKKRTEIEVPVTARPVRMDVDPEFDVFRRLSGEEIPPAVSQALGSKKMLVLLPASADVGLLEAYKNTAKSLARTGIDSVEVKMDSEVERLPSDSAVTLFGWENRFLGDAVTALSGYNVKIDKKEMRLEMTLIPRTNHSVVLAARNPADRNMALMLIASDRAEALPGLMRKLPHYHKYSFLGFEGDEPANVAKGRWPVLNSPMTAFIQPQGEGVPKIDMGRNVLRDPLATLPQVFSSERMLASISFLSGDELQGRGFGTEGLDRASDFIAAKFREAGLKPAGDQEGSYFQTWEEAGGDPQRNVVMRNVVGVIPGKKPECYGQSVVVGAHYDHLGLGWPDVRGDEKGKVHHGADDNASGVSVLIELATVLSKGQPPDRSIVFVAFTGEEAGRRGSTYYIAHEKKYPAERCFGMLNLDTVGRLEKKKLLVLGSGSAREWVHIFRGAGFVTGVPLETVAERLDSSDQTSFEDKGIPAVQLFAGPHTDYHRPSDRADSIDAEGLVKVASVAKEAIEYLAGREGPLTAASNSEKPGPGEKSERKVSLGLVPDFAFSGQGLRLSGVLPGSPAEECGLREGDVVVRLDSADVKGLKDLSDILKRLMPGAKVSITFLRDGRDITVETETKAK